MNKAWLWVCKHRWMKVTLIIYCEHLSFAPSLTFRARNRWVEAVDMRDTTARVATVSVVDIERVNHLRLAAVLADEAFDRAQLALQAVILSEHHDPLQHLFECAVLDQREIRRRVKMDRLVNIFFGEEKLVKLGDCALGASEDVSSDEIQLDSQLLQAIHLINVRVNVRV